MALDQSFVGRSYPPTAAYEVGREKIREFAEAIGDENPVYTDPEAAKALGHPDVIAPPTFPFAITFKAAGLVVQDPELGLDYSRVVHGDQKFAYTRPVRAGDRLTVTSTIEAIKSLAGNDILDVRGEVHDESGEHVVTAWTKLVARAADTGTENGEA
ncbi:MaoC family dehydratase N-terminal domain-containing protein [Streptomyces sp. NPDC020917]|uniref:FAS1-like dehydratase domain-containing protein n=1 Tax=Streptomyces sp. NPDC020917 TaxID=3365102 RepID=UPI0037B64B3C